MKCIELVLQDHAELCRGLDIIDGMLRQLEDGQRIEIADVITVLRFLRIFGDEYHQAMEEQILFPALLGAAPEQEGLRQLVCDHGDERLLVEEIEETLISRKGMAFFRSAHHLTALLRHHCDKEEAIVGALAGRCLSKEQDETVVAEFIKARPRCELQAKFPRLEQKYAARRISEEMNPAAPLVRARASSSYG
jgi:hemerythrin-like domain-containing protein